MLRRPMMMRRGPRLLGTVARTAAVAGTAAVTVNAVGNAQSRKREAANEQQAVVDQQQQQIDALQAQAAPAPAAPSAGDLTSKLKQLADLKAAGALSDAEFAAAKAKLLGI